MKLFLFEIFAYAFGKIERVERGEAGPFGFDYSVAGKVHYTTEGSIEYQPYCQVHFLLANLGMNMTKSQNLLP